MGGSSGLGRRCVRRYVESESAGGPKARSKYLGAARRSGSSYTFRGGIADQGSIKGQGGMGTADWFAGRLAGTCAVPAGFRMKCDNHCPVCPICQ